MDHLSENLQLLVGYGKSVTDICRQANINRTQFNRYLSGQSLPSLQSLRRICDFFGVDEKELLLDSAAFRQIIRLRPPQLRRSEDPALRFVQDLFRTDSDRENVAGYYHFYFQPEPDVPHIYCNLVRLARTRQGLVVRIIERHTHSAINLPDRMVYDGTAFVRSGKLHSLVQERKMGRSTWYTVLSLGDFGEPGLLNGTTTGTEPEGGNSIATFNAIWKFLGEKPDVRAALRQCGCFERSDIDLSPAILAGIS